MSGWHDGLTNAVGYVIKMKGKANLIIAHVLQWDLEQIGRQYLDHIPCASTAGSAMSRIQYAFGLWETVSEVVKEYSTL